MQLLNFSIPKHKRARSGLNLAWAALLAALLMAALACNAAGVAVTQEAGGVNPSATMTLEAPTLHGETPTPTYPCPLATPELPPQVQPLTSPTQELSQVVVVNGFFDHITIQTVSGTFEANGTQVEVKLLPNTIHNLIVSGHVPKTSGFGGCDYGNYTLTTTTDINGKSLMIVQGTPPATASQPISPQNAALLQQIGILQQAAPVDPQQAISMEGMLFLSKSELLTYGANQPLLRWSLPDLKPLGALTQENLAEQSALCAALSPDGRWLATCSSTPDASVRLWDMQTGAMRALGSAAVGCRDCGMAFSPNGKLLAAGGANNQVQVWEVDSGRLAATLTADAPNLIETFFEITWLDDTHLWGNGSIPYQWDLGSGKIVQKLPGGGQGFFAWNPASRGWIDWPTAGFPGGVRYDPSGRVAAAARDSGFVLVDAASQAVLGEWPTPVNYVYRFSPDGLYLATMDLFGRQVALWGVP